MNVIFSLQSLISSVNIVFFLCFKKGFFPNAIACSPVYPPTPRQDTRMALEIVWRQMSILEAVDHGKELSKNTT